MFVYQKDNKICIDNVTNGVPKETPDITASFNADGEAVVTIGTEEIGPGAVSE